MLMLRPYRHWILVTLVGFLDPAAAAEDGVREPDPLFAAHDVLTVTIEAPLDTILDERSLEDELPGRFILTDTAGETKEFDIQI